MTEQLFTKATERMSYGYIDYRAIWGGDSGGTEAKFDPFEGFWRLKNMVAVCCGLEGPTEKIKDGRLTIDSRD